MNREEAELIATQRQAGNPWQSLIAALGRHETACAGMILVLVLHIVFFPFLWGGKTLLSSARDAASIVPSGSWAGTSAPPLFPKGLDPGAAAWESEAWLKLIRHQYLFEKNLPFWNPYQGYGTPLAANMQSQPFYPLTVLLSLHATPLTYNLFILLRLFIAGLFTYFYLRLFISFVPAVAGGIAMMLTGYYLLYLTMPHLSVDVLIPAVFFSMERLLRCPGVRTVLMVSAITFLTIVGGMPESTLLALSFGYLYFCYRLLTSSQYRPAILQHLCRLAIGTIVGFGSAAFLLAPFVEFMQLSFDVHQPRNAGGQLIGLAHDLAGWSLWIYVVPLLFGPPWNNIITGGHSGARGFFGVMPLLFAVIAVFMLFRRRTTEWRLPFAVTLFFTFSAIAFVLKRYGSSFVNWVGWLPLFRMVEFSKYLEPLLAFSVAVLCGIGVEHVLNRSARGLRILAGLLLVFMLVGAAFANVEPAIQNVADNQIFYLSTRISFALLFLAGLTLGFDAGSPARGNRGWLVPGLLLALLTTESAANYVYPTYYFLNRLPDQTADPFLGAPFVRFLQANSGRDRIFGRDGLLFPNWASAFNLADVRDLDAMYSGKYLPFVRAFFPDSKLVDRDRYDRFIGTDNYAFANPLEQRFLQLSSVKNIVTMRPYLPHTSSSSAILDQNKGHLLAGRENYIEIRSFTIQDDTQAVLFEHPPYERLPFRTKIHAQRDQLSFSIAMDPSVYTGCGDGVNFLLEARDDKGHIEPLYSRYIDPKHNVNERKWFPFVADLKKYSGQTVDLLFTTDPGPRGDNCADWAGWGDVRFQDEAEAIDFKLVYDGEAKVYRYDQVLPRAAIFHRVEFSDNDEGALQRLTAPEFDIFQSVVVTSAGLSPEQKADYARVNTFAASGVEAAKLISYDSQSVEIDASVENPSILMLNDTAYPGWKAYIDDRPVPWVTSDYLFRGVLVEPGQHKVRFLYQSEAIAAGLRISVFTVLSTLLVVLFFRRRVSASNPEIEEMTVS